MTIQIFPAAHDNEFLVIDVPLHLKQAGKQDTKKFSTQVDQQISEAVNKAYEVRVNLGRDPLQIIFVLDRRLDWSRAPTALKQAEATLRSRSTRSRNPNSFQWLLYSAGHKIMCRSTHKPSSRSSLPQRASMLINMVRSFEMTRMIDHESVLLHHGRAALFLLPSGIRSDFFLRVGNIQAQPGSIQKIAFWCIHKLKDVDFVLSDTWSISSIAAGMCQFIHFYRSPKSKSQSHPRWSSLSGYLPGSSIQENAVKDVFRDPNTKKVLFLISATSSGALHKAFCDLARERGSEMSIDTTALYSLSTNQDVESLCSLVDFLETRGLRNTVSDFSAGQSPVFRINSRTYFPDYGLQRESRFEIAKLAKTYREFYHTYASNEVFSVAKYENRNRSGKHQYFSYYVDTDRLFSHPAFQAKLENKLSTRPPVDSIVIKRSDYDEGFWNHFRSKYFTRFRRPAPSHQIIENYWDLLNESSHIVDTIADASKHVLFLDRCVFNGDSLGELARVLRICHDSGRSPAAFMTYFIGLLRPHSCEQLRWLRYFDRCCDNFGFPDRVKLEAVEEVVLPLWSEMDCPWQLEMNGHMKSVRTNKVRFTADERYAMQRIYSIAQQGNRNGLRGMDVFMVPRGMERLTLASGSLWLDVSQVQKESNRWFSDGRRAVVDEADVACVAGSIIQLWRDQGASSEVVSRVLSERQVSEAVASSAMGFNDPMLRAGIWRALRQEEVVSSRSNVDSVNLLREIFSGADRNWSSAVLAGEASLLYSWRLESLLAGNECASNRYWMKFAKNLGRLNK